jgi:phytoene dehydrogenase-like protein
MNGYKTKVFEMHDVPGGLCTSWKRKGYTFDGCMHWMVGSRHGIYHRFYEELGGVQDRPIIDHDEIVRFEGPEGRTWILYTDLERLKQHTKEHSPADARVIEKFCRGARRIGRLDPPVEKPPELMGPMDMLTMLKSLGGMLSMLRYSRISNQDFASRFSDPFLREVFPLILDDMPDFTLMAPLLALGVSHEGNGGWPTGGSLEFARAIERRFLALGGEIQYKAPVAKILTENDRAVGVRLADGTEHRADVVLSAADGRTTIFDMLDGKYLDDKIRRCYDEWPVYGCYVQVSLGVARDFSGEPHSVKTYLPEPIRVGDKDYNWLHLQHYCHDATMAPPGKSVLKIAFMNINYDYWKKLYEDREGYKAEKNKVRDAVIGWLEKRFPGIKDQIEVTDVATPVTFERYTGNWRASYMGWADTSKMTGKMMSKTLPGLGSFYMAGQWVRMGGGVPGSVASGRHAIQIICKKDKNRFVATTP